MYEPRIFEPSTLFDSWEGAFVTEQQVAPAEPARAAAQPEQRTFELPARVWMAMAACYAIFLVAIALALSGSAVALFMVAISAGYTAMYFGAGTIVAKQAGAQPPSPLQRGLPLQTWTGPMGAPAVYGQVLVVPIAVAAFGLIAAGLIALLL